RLAEPVTAGQDVLAPLLPPDRVGGDGGECLVDGPGGEPEVGRGAALPAEVTERVEKGPLEVLSEGRFPGDAAGLFEADGRGDDRRVGATLGGERDAGGRADQDRLATGIEPEGPRFEGPVDERVVDRADGEEGLAVARPG